MAKFCTKCGKPLVDGKECDCRKNIEEKKEEIPKKEVEEQREEKVTEKQAESKDLVNSIIDIFKNCWKTPSKLMMKYQKKNIILALSLIAINIVVFGILTYCLVNNTYNGIIEEINTKIQSIASLGGESLAKNAELIPKADIPFMSIFISGAIVLAAGYLMLVTMARLFFGKIFKGKGKFGNYLTVAGIATPLSTVIMVVAILTSFISYKLALLIAIISSIAFHVLFIHGNMEILKAKQNKVAYAEALTVSLTVIISIFIFIVTLSVMIAIIINSKTSSVYDSSSTIPGISTSIVTK